MKKHYILMGGISGCLPSHCDAYTRLSDAIDTAKQIYDSDRGLVSDLRKHRYCDRVSGNDYVEIVECTCDTPWVHSEDLDPYQIQDWHDLGYHRFEVIEYSSGYAVYDRVSEKEHWMSDGVDVLFGKNGNPIMCGTESFRKAWERFLNESYDDTKDAYFPDSYL